MNAMSPSVQPKRLVLEGVPRVGPYRGGPRPPEGNPFPACLRAFLEYLGKPHPLQKLISRNDPWWKVHVNLVGATGLAFRLLWDRQHWDPASTAITTMALDALEPIRLGFEAIGYGHEVLLRKDFAAGLGIAQEQDYSEADFRERIIASLKERSRPVIAIGVVGPPECCLLTGYDEGGDVLIGWSFFQDEPDFSAGLAFEPSGYFRAHDWFAKTQGLLLIGEPQETPTLGTIYRKALCLGLELMRTPWVRQFAGGQAAYSDWAESLLRDGEYAADKADDLRRRHEYHWMTAGTLAEARAWGSAYLRTIAEAEPAAEQELLAAAKCFDDEHDLVWAIWQFTRVGHTWERDQAAFGDGCIRRRIVPLIRLARRRDAEAAAHIERALAAMGTPYVPRRQRLVLEGVPKIGYHRHLCPLPGSLYACMQYLEDPCDYDYLMGVTGAAFRRFWQDGDGGNVDLMYLAPQPHRRAFEALNYDYQTVPKDRAAMLAAIEASIARGRPVLSFGIIGPPECGLIIGYDRGGEVLLGYSYFQDAAIQGYYEQANWFEQMDAGGPYGLIVVGDRQVVPGPSRRELLISSLEWACDLARTAVRPERPNHLSGLAAYDGWSAWLEADASHPLGDDQALGVGVMLHGDQTIMLSERRNAAAFLRQMLPAAPEVAHELNTAATLYDQIAQQESGVWRWGMDMGVAVAQDLAKPAMRREIARYVRLAKEKETEAVEHLERALFILKAG